MSAPDTIAGIRVLLIEQHIAPDAHMEGVWRGEDTTWDDLGADSLALVELFFAVMEEWDIDIPDEVVERIETVGELAKVIDAAVAARKAVPA